MCSSTIYGRGVMCCCRTALTAVTKNPLQQETVEDCLSDLLKAPPPPCADSHLRLHLPGRGSAVVYKAMMTSGVQRAL